MIGCATCHTPKLGDVGGIYSDLLLHDLGPQLGDTGQYGVFDPSSSEEEIVDPVQPIADASADLPPRIVVGTLPGLPPPVPSRPPAADTVAVTVAPQAVVPAPAAPPQGEPTSTALPLAPPGPVPPFAIAPQADAGLVAVVPDQASFAMSPMPMMPGAPTPAKRPTSGPASRFEWRTPPLWGFRDSGPYLHDGRAETLDQAVALHGGEAAMISARFFALDFKERRQLEAFLKSLTAPPPSRAAGPRGELTRSAWSGKTSIRGCRRNETADS